MYFNEEKEKYDNKKNNNLGIIENTQNMPYPINNPKNMINYKQNISFQNQQNYNNIYYNNINSINNNIINQNNINIINNNIDYINQKNKATTTNTYINNNINMNRKPIEIKTKCTCSKTGCKKKYCACFSKGFYCENCECKDCENKPFIGQNVNNSINKINQENIENANISKEEELNTKIQKVVCNCSKSNCTKKYCECYKQGFKCNSLCRCLECKNKNYINNDTNNFYNYALNYNNNINNNLSQDSTPHFTEALCKSIDYNNPKNYHSEAFGIFINREKMQIEGRKINLNIENNQNNKIRNKNYESYNNGKEISNSYNFGDRNETPKFSNKKRLRGKNENSAGIKTCPTTNSSKRKKKSVSVINKNIKKKRLQLN